MRVVRGHTCSCQGGFHDAQSRCHQKAHGRQPSRKKSVQNRYSLVDVSISSLWMLLHRTCGGMQRTSQANPQCRAHCLDSSPSKAWSKLSTQTYLLHLPLCLYLISGLRGVGRS